MSDAKSGFNIHNTFKQKITYHSGNKTLENVRKFFFLTKDGAKVNQYAILELGATFPASSLRNEDLHYCAICGTPLFHVKTFAEQIRLTDEDVNASARLRRIMKDELDISEDDKPYVIYNNRNLYAKRHMVFQDTAGRQYRTCYRVSDCFARINWDTSTTSSDLSEQPTIEDVVPINFDEDRKSEAFKRLTDIFNDVVCPFIDKWTYVAIDKGNCIEFLSDMDKLDVFLEQFDERSKQRVLANICRCVGVKS